MSKNNSKINQDLEDLQRYIEELTIFLPLAFCAVNPLDVILGVNQTFQELTGYGEMEMMGRKIEDLFLEKRKINAFKRRIPRENRRIKKEMTLLTKDKKKILVSVFALARRDEKGDFLGYFLTLFDISETKKFEEELEKKVRERTEELRDRIEELEKFDRLTVNRELKMIELKEEIRRLEEKLRNCKS